MREFDAPAKILSEDMEVHGEILAHPPRSPNLLMRALIQKADPFKPQLRPWDYPRHNWRKNAREDFYFKAAVLLATMAFDGKDGHRPLTDAKAVGLWHDLQTGKKQRGEDTLLRIWKRRDSGFKQHAWTPPGKRWAAPGKRWADAPYLTRADRLTMLANTIRDVEEHHAARRAKAYADSPGGQTRGQK